MAEERGTIEVSRRIVAPAERIFAVLADPSRHTEFDGSEMLRGVADGGPITGVGQVFVMNMYFDRLGGDYVMRNHVVEFEPGRRIAWTPAPGDERSSGEHFGYDQPPGHVWRFELTPDGSNATVVTETYDCKTVPQWFKETMNYGEVWRESMEQTLERLEKVFAA